LLPLQTYGVQLEAPERTNQVAGRYAAAVEELAAELQLPCLNLWRAFQDVEGWQQRLLSDGLHLTAEGNAELFRLLRQLIDTRFSDLRQAAWWWGAGRLLWLR
jgi:lysophospholipase L1-like esterase